MIDFNIMGPFSGDIVVSLLITGGRYCPCVCSGVCLFVFCEKSGRYNLLVQVGFIFPSAMPAITEIARQIPSSDIQVRVVIVLLLLYQNSPLLAVDMRKAGVEEEGSVLRRHHNPIWAQAPQKQCLQLIVGN